jgi:hypothetical protein
MKNHKEKTKTGLYNNGLNWPTYVLPRSGIKPGTLASKGEVWLGKLPRNFQFVIYQ